MYSGYNLRGCLFSTATVDDMIANEYCAIPDTEKALKALFSGCMCKGSCVRKRDLSPLYCNVIKYIGKRQASSSQEMTFMEKSDPFCKKELTDMNNIYGLKMEIKKPRDGCIEIASLNRSLSSHVFFAKWH
ncbi:hypothetical protein TNIN_454031 [Trichonephila inaurata madagascariensis]|uniref:Uncharacterized protein n=1 Tax=Trichonephila inaurata madagascariensis TaxID=2747483 RepID=A0A8X7BRZ6_9ARAC|nr:hypothetical protein TNIN_454031 [Trichonephila inaurata madagascariensis]